MSEATRPPVHHESPTRGIFFDQERQRMTFVCAFSNLRWHVPFDRMTPQMKRQWRGEREINWLYGLHGRAAADAIHCRTVH